MISRRVFTAGLAAIPAGTLGGLLVRRWTSSSASVRFLGRRDSMISLLDTGNERALFLLGEPDAELIDFLPQLLTVGNTRVDLIVGSHRWLTTAGIRSALDFEHSTTLSLQADSSVPSLAGKVTAVTQFLRVRLGDNAEIEIGIDQGLGREPTDPLAAVHITCNGATLALASSEAAASASRTGTNLLAIPGDVSTNTIERVSPAIFVGTSLHPDSELTELQMFHNEPIGLTIDNGSLSVREGQLSS